LSGSISFCLNVDPFPIPCTNPVSNPMPRLGIAYQLRVMFCAMPCVSMRWYALPRWGNDFL
jgi:hypothetical protein